MNYFKIIFVLLVFTLFSCQGQNSSNRELIDVKTFSEKITSATDLQLLDVRTPEEFNEQHLDNATNINWNGADFEHNASKFNKSKPLYVYCRSGARSTKAVEKLIEMGFTKIYELDGGMLKWNASGIAEKTSETSGMTKQDFDKLLVSGKKVLVNFYSESCTPCEDMTPYLKKITATMAEKFLIIHINVDKNKGLAEELKVEILPTLMLYDNKELKWKNSGFISEENLTKKL